MQIAVEHIQLLAESVIDASELLVVVEDIALVVDVDVRVKTRRIYLQRVGSAAPFRRCP